MGIVVIQKGVVLINLSRKAILFDGNQTIVDGPSTKNDGISYLKTQDPHLLIFYIQPTPSSLHTYSLTYIITHIIELTVFF